MAEHYTDTENTGAPLVPIVEKPSDSTVPPKGEFEEVVLSHRLRD